MGAAPAQPRIQLSHGAAPGVLQGQTSINQGGDVSRRGTSTKSHEQQAAAWAAAGAAAAAAERGQLVARMANDANIGFALAVMAKRLAGARGHS